MARKRDEFVAKRGPAVRVDRSGKLSAMRDGGRKSCDWYGNELVTIEPGGKRLTRAEIMQRVECLLKNVEE